MAAALPHFADYAPAIARARVLVAGDVMLDRYWFGDVDRISPEAVSIGRAPLAAGSGAIGISLPDTIAGAVE